MGIAALASEVLETLPPDHPNYPAVADEEAQAHLALGWTDRALERYEGLREAHERRAQAEPDRADYQVDLAISLHRAGIAGDSFEREPIEQALEILLALQEAGRIAPQHESKISALREVLRKGGIE